MRKDISIENIRKAYHMFIPQKIRRVVWLIRIKARNTTSSVQHGVLIREVKHKIEMMICNCHWVYAIVTGKKIQTHKKYTYITSGYTAYEIEREEVLPITEPGQSDGYHKYGTRWWINPSCPYSYKYLSINAMYPKEYFASRGDGHPAEAAAKELYEYMQKVYVDIFGKRFSSVLELGVGGGEITAQFHCNNLDYLAVEGTSNGVQQLKVIGIPESKIIFENLKFLKPVNRKFDIVMCTEVAEHIEPWFASKVVENCISYSDVVWFSAAKGNNRPHYHHINEVPIEAWDNIFAHFGFNHFIQLNGMWARADRLYSSRKL